MKVLNKIFIILMSCLLFNANAMGQGMNFYDEPIEAKIMFVPMGFDDNDNAQVVLEGWLPDSCSKILPPVINYDLPKGDIEVVLMVRRYNMLCIPLESRFSVVADLGPIPYGDYKIYNKLGSIEKDLSIMESSNSGPDDELYAYVRNVVLDYAPDLVRDGERGKWSVLLEGDFLDSCERFSDIELLEQDDVFVILPKIKSEGEICADIVIPFVRRVDLPQLDDNRYLVHVRKRNGQADNQVFSARPN